MYRIFIVGKLRNSNYRQASGFNFQRIVFTYLDYILYRDGYTLNNMQIISPLEEGWTFQFRNSIEHFYPRNPRNKGEVEIDKDSFGNLALITVAANSMFSNKMPQEKINRYLDRLDETPGYKIVNQSMKLRIMLEIFDGKSEEEYNCLITKHGEEMFDLLDREIESYSEV